MAGSGVLRGPGENCSIGARGWGAVDPSAGGRALDNKREVGDVGDATG